MDVNEGYEEGEGKQDVEEEEEEEGGEGGELDDVDEDEGGNTIKGVESNPETMPLPWSLGGIGEGTGEGDTERAETAALEMETE